MGKLKINIRKMMPSLCFCGTVAAHIIINEQRHINNINNLTFSDQTRKPGSSDGSAGSRSGGSLEKQLKQHLLNITDKNVWMENTLANLQDEEFDELVNDISFRKTYEEVEGGNHFLRAMISRFCSGVDERITKRKPTYNEKYFCGATDKRHRILRRSKRKGGKCNEVNKSKNEINRRELLNKL